MSTFAVDITVADLGLSRPGRQISALVDTGAAYTMLPMDLIEEIGARPAASRQVVFADGREANWPLTYVWITLDGEDGPTLCLIGPRGATPLLGALTLEQFALGVDPVNQRLVPIRSHI